MLINKLLAPATEGDITTHWKYTDKVYISCVCITYNQEEYIQDTIDSMLAQKCEFRFEIIIHDDLSTDGTRNILKSYRDKYPSIIKLVLQEENQFSKGKKITPLAIEYACGDYIALCEGDDFWICEDKLQKQVDLLVNSNNINICISKAISLFSDETTKSFCDLGSYIKIIPFEECIIGPQKDFFPTGSFFLKREVFNLLPDWFQTEAPVADYYIQLISAKYNGVLYLPDTLSVYRRDTIGSWSKGNNNNKILIDLEKRINCIYLLSPTIDLKYRKTLRLKIAIYQYMSLRVHMSNHDCIKSFKLILSLLKNIDVIINYKIKNKIM